MHTSTCLQPLKGLGAYIRVSFFSDDKCTTQRKDLYGGTFKTKDTAECDDKDWDTKKKYASTACPAGASCFKSLLLHRECPTFAPASNGTGTPAELYNSWVQPKPSHQPALLAICPTHSPTLLPLTMAPLTKPGSVATCTHDVSFYTHSNDCTGAVLQKYSNVVFNACLQDYTTGNPKPLTRFVVMTITL